MTPFRIAKITDEKLNKKHSLIQDISPVIFESESEQGDYYLFLTDTLPTRSSLNKLRTDLTSLGIWNYRVVCAATKKFTPGDTDKVARFFRTASSDWEKYLDRNGVHNKFVVTFGYALFGVTKSSDIVPQDFYCADYLRYYFYIGKSEVGNYNSFFVPVESLSDCYPLNEKHPDQWRNWTTRMFMNHVEKAMKGLQLPDMKEFTFKQIESKEEATQVFLDHMSCEQLAWDTETSSLNPWKGKLVCLTITFDGNTAYFIPWKFVPTGLLVRVFASAKRIIGANVKFDQKWLWANNAKVRCATDDVGILSHFINTERHKGLKALSFIYTYFGGYDYPLDKYKETHVKITYDKIPQYILAPYASIDAIATYRVYEALIKECRQLDTVLPTVQPKMEGWSIERFYRTIAMPTQNLYCDVEFRGIYIDKQRLDSSRQLLDNEINKSKKAMAKIWNVLDTFEFGSTAKLGRLLEERNYPEVNRNKQGILQTDENSLAEWKRLNMPGIDELIRFRGLMSCRNTFLGYTDYTNLDAKEKGWEQFIIKHEDGSYRIHPVFDVFGTETLRFKVSEPNTQNLPTHNEFAYLVKECFGVPCASWFSITKKDGTVVEGWFNDKIDLNDGQGERQLNEVKNFEVQSIVETQKPVGYHGLETCDFGSLQARITTIDTCLNPQGIDPALYELYKVNSPLGSDMHSMTAFNVFCKPFHSQVAEVTDDTGKVWIIGDASRVTVKRNGQDVVCGMDDIQEQDTIVAVN